MDIIERLEKAGDAPADPLALFNQGLTQAHEKETSDPTAMCLATANAQGHPSARMVLLKNVDERGFTFFTNAQSRKGRDLIENPYAALCFYWETLSWQVRIEGPVEKISAAEDDSYFATRSRGSRIGAWASEQSRTLDSRHTLAARVQEFSEKFKDDIPRPPWWGGYRLIPAQYEFWHEGQDRLHTRLIYVRQGTEWHRELLYP